MLRAEGRGSTLLQYSNETNDSAHFQLYLRCLFSMLCRGVGTMGTGGTLYPQVQDLYPLYPQVKDAAYIKILSKRL